jgi:hypothetical protein
MRLKGLVVIAGLMGSFLLLSSLALANPITHVHLQTDESGALTNDDNQLLAEIRHETATFRDVDTAVDAGYESFLDCMSDPDEGGMGQHYVNGDLVGDTEIDPLQPEALVYEPQEDGSLILIGFEYIAFKEQWDAENDAPPTMLGQEFGIVENLADLPPFYALHVWVFNYNPNGLFARYSPNVFCPEAMEM